MNIRFALVAALAGTLMAGSAHASTDTNSLSLFSNPSLANVASLDVKGDHNRLEISQDFDGGRLGNSLSLTIRGDLNGGPLGSAFVAPLASVGLAPGQISQTGYGNAMSIGIHGSNNLFAALQSGSGNTLTATVIGTYNQAAVAQYGSGNSLSFTQNGTGNVLSVVQRSW